MVCEDTLRVKNLPKELTNTEREDFLRHFGATNVKLITSHNKGTCIAYAKFESKEVAKNVLFRLHQLVVLNSRLTVEYADHDIGQGKLKLKPAEALDSNNVKHFKSFINKLTAWNSAVSFNQPPAAHLKYVYPKANRATINNIAHALAIVPKFYTQVLHLMNRMNLPPPFSNVPDQPQLAVRPPQPQIQKNSSTLPLPTENESEESELESDPEDSSKLKTIIPMKRNLSQKKNVKRPKFIKPSVGQQPSACKVGESLEEVFETTNIQQKKIEMKVSSESLEEKINKAATDDEPEQKLESVDNQPEEKSENKIITEQELQNNRIPLKDLGVLPVFKDYHPGIPSSRLYIKNIAKTVEKSDLEYIFKRYIEDAEKSLFDIKLMTEGRMKGQAFITLDSVELAQKAVTETTGFILKDKPLVVVFAKSTQKK